MSSSFMLQESELYSREAQKSVPRLQNFSIIVSQPSRERNEEGRPFFEGEMLKVLDQALDEQNIDPKEVKNCRIYQHFVRYNTKNPPQYGKYRANSLEIDFDIDSTEVEIKMEIEMKNGHHYNALTSIRTLSNGFEYLNPIIFY